MTGFTYYECLDCSFSSIQKDDFKGTDICPLCEGDCGHIVHMITRPAKEEDKPEGFDARKGTREEQEAARKVHLPIST